MVKRYKPPSGAPKPPPMPSPDLVDMDKALIEVTPDPVSARACKALRKAALRSKSLAAVQKKLKLTDDQAMTFLQRALRQCQLPATDIEMMRALGVAKYEEIQREAWNGYARTRADEVVITKVTEVVDGQEVTKTTERRKGQAGDPAFLRVLVEAEKRLDALLGREMPKQLHVQTKKQVAITEIVVHTRDDVERYEQVMLGMDPDELEDKDGSHDQTITIHTVPSPSPAAP